jgi:hypothetical protein
MPHKRREWHCSPDAGLGLVSATSLRSVSHFGRRATLGSASHGPNRCERVVETGSLGVGDEATGVGVKRPPHTRGRFRRHAASRDRLHVVAAFVVQG